MVAVLVMLPMVGALAALAVASNRWRPVLLPVTAIAHLGLAVYLLLPGAGAARLNDWLALDAPGKVVLPLVSVIFLACAFYAVGYLRVRSEKSNRIFCACLLSLLGIMTLVTFAQHLGILWVSVEATALATAPLIYFNRTPRSIEATWKYLLVGSVGIAVALLGTFFLAYSSVRDGAISSLVVSDLVGVGPQLSRPWLQAAFVLLLVGYGTKMGLAPMHTWKPDAYGEAPGLVGAVLAGGVTSCAFLAILRIYRVMAAAGSAPFANSLLITLGLLSMGVAAVFMLGQRDFKRMLAYSSIEHMGILVLGVGLGGGATFGALLHLVNNGLAKGVLFLAAGNIHRAYGSKSTDEVHGAIARVPVSAGLFLAGFIAITGSPPFAPFVSQFTILSGAFAGGRYVCGALFLLFLMIIFVGMSATVLKVVQGPPPAEGKTTSYRDSLLTAAPVAALMAGVLFLGLYVPPPIRQLVTQAAESLVNTP